MGSAATLHSLHASPVTNVGLAVDSAALVVLLGCDTVTGDPHGSRRFGPEVFGGIGRLLAAAGPPICIVQEGGHWLDAGPVQSPFAAGLLEKIRHETPPSSAALSPPAAPGPPRSRRAPVTGPALEGPPSRPSLPPSTPSRPAEQAVAAGPIPRAARRDGRAPRRPAR